MANKEFNAREDTFWSAYRTNDLQGAEKALLDGLKSLPTYEKNYTVDGIDFNAHRAFFHERLYLIYQATQDTNRMESELRESMNFVNQSRASWHLPAIQMTQKEFASALTNLDQGKDVRWKREIIGHN
jgi:hypothetical protein